MNRDSASQTHNDWREIENVLAVRLDAMGDVLMTTPAIRALKQSRPAGRRITLLTSPAGAALARMVAEIDDVIVYVAPWMKAAKTSGNPAQDTELIALLRERKFDGAVIFTVFSQSALPAALLCYLAGIPRRLAYCRENPYILLTTWIPEMEPQMGLRHEVLRQLDLVAHAGADSVPGRLSLRITDRAFDRARDFVAAQGMDVNRPWAIVHPGATAPSRRYSPKRYAQAAAALVRDHGWQVIYTGSICEAPLVECIRDAMQASSFSAAGALDLETLCALIALAPVIIVNNTGPAHIAAAVGTPVVDLYALTNLQHTPWLVASRVLYHDVPCKNCYKSTCPMGHHDCLGQVSPDRVVSAALEMADIGRQRNNILMSNGLKKETGGVYAGN